MVVVDIQNISLGPVNNRDWDYSQRTILVFGTSPREQSDYELKCGQRTLLVSSFLSCGVWMCGVWWWWHPDNHQRTVLTQTSLYIHITKYVGMVVLSYRFIGRKNSSLGARYLCNGSCGLTV